MEICACSCHLSLPEGRDVITININALDRIKKIIFNLIMILHMSKIFGFCN